MYYYGARYYDPKMSLFVSVDPLAEQFQGWSPYNYTMNNPLNLVDPTGMAPEAPDHDYRLGKNGKITKIRDTKNDFHRIYNSDGSDNITVSKEFMDFSYNSESGKSQVYPMFNKDVKSGGGKSIFKFFADNTDVEMGYSEFKNNKSGNSFGFLITSNKLKTIYDVPETISPYMSDKNTFLTYNGHSHPLDYDAGWYHYGTTPSGFVPTKRLNTILDPGVNRRTGAVEGDRAVYKGLKENFGGRIPKYFDLYTPKAPNNINVKYNDRTAIRKSN